MKETPNAVAPSGQPHTENKMGFAPIPKLIFSMSLPIMISMLV